jgi:hypothetical protein
MTHPLKRFSATVLMARSELHGDTPRLDAAPQKPGRGPSTAKYRAPEAAPHVESPIQRVDYGSSPDEPTVAPKAVASRIVAHDPAATRPNPSQTNSSTGGPPP